MVPLLLSTANVSGIEWDKVDGSSLATQKTASFQVSLFDQGYLKGDLHSWPTNIIMMMLIGGIEGPRHQLQFAS